MMANLPNESVNQYILQASHAVRDDLLEVIQMMAQIAPEAELVSELGIPYFRYDARWLYGVAAREDHLCVYFSDLSVLYSFASRLPEAQFGDDCLIIHQLKDINRNVLMELFGQIKVHFFLNKRESETPIH